MKTASITLILFITRVLFAGSELPLVEKTTLSVHLCSSGVFCELSQHVSNELSSSSVLVQNIELCTSEPFASFAVKNGAVLCAGYIYDYSNGSLYGVPAMDGQGKRWSPSGIFTVFSYTAAGSVYIIRTADLRRFLESASEECVYITISGDPNGCTYAEAWLGDRFLLFSTGQGDITHWGLADTTLGTVYVLDPGKQATLLHTAQVGDALFMLLQNSDVLTISSTGTNFFDVARKVAQATRKGI